MEHISLEHANITVSDPEKTAAWMQTVFGWRIRWQGPALNTGYTVHVGTDAQYLALYCAAGLQKTPSDPDGFLGGLIHIGVCVRDLVACESRAKKAGFTPRDHAEYEPGSRFIFMILMALSMKWSAIPLNNAVASTGPVLEAF